MKLIRSSDGRTGLVVEIDSRPCIIDIVRSLSIFLPHDPLSNGLLNGLLRQSGDWALLLKHWVRVRYPLESLERTVLHNPNHPGLVTIPWDEFHSMPGRPEEITELEVAEFPETAASDPSIYGGEEFRNVVPFPSTRP